MKRLFLCFLIIAVNHSLFCKGAQETPTPPLNNTWTLCVTAFDTSAVPPSRIVMGQMVMQYIVENIRTAETRLWTSQEAAYYNEAAQLKALRDAAAKVRDKQTERDKLIFAGETNRKYKQNLKRVDKELETLRYNLEKIQTFPSHLALSPAVKFTEGNTNGNFPLPPAAGQEYYFCTGQKADAFLSGRISEYFDRIYVEISLWSIYARRMTYTDSVIFSPEDIKEGSVELANRLFDHISGFLPAWIKVKASPSNAIIVIDDYVAGRGETELMDFTPGTVSVTAFTRDYETFETNIELREGERVDVSVELLPKQIVEFDVSLKDGGIPVYSEQVTAGSNAAGSDAAGSDAAGTDVAGSDVVGNDVVGSDVVDSDAANTDAAGSDVVGSDVVGSDVAGTDGVNVETAAVYDGAMYVGETPIRLSGAVDQQRNINIETPDGRIAQTVFRVSDKPIVFDPRMPPAQDRTDIARKKFYSAYGRFWIALPLAILGMGLNNTVTSVYKATNDPEIGQQQQIVYWTSIGLTAAMGLFLAESFYRIGRYVWEANKESSPLIKKQVEPESGDSGTDVKNPVSEGETVELEEAAADKSAEEDAVIPESADAVKEDEIVENDENEENQ
ncbi:MAG: PEGA domain-containing protein [Treponema sp.]|jgi:hypothetical protein|nr:PEGA domain-containing protein [Treponema sp.]